MRNDLRDRRLAVAAREAAGHHNSDLAWESEGGAIAGSRAAAGPEDTRRTVTP